MKRMLLPLVVTTLLSSPLAFAQAPADFSGTWRMDPSRSESAMQGDPIGPVTVVITQTPSHIHIATTSPKGTSTEVYRIDGSQTPLTVGEGRAWWTADSLVFTAIRDVRGVSVTTEQSRRLVADGREMHVDSVVEVQHGYTLSKTKNYGAGRDVFVRVK